MTLPETKLEVAALSETGYVRNENQDRMTGSSIPLGHLFIVADGMGGHKGGGVAAEMTVTGLQKFFEKAPADASVEEVIQKAIDKVNQDVYRKAHSGQAEIEGMGSCLVLLLVSGTMARVAHVGDSRAYLYRKGQLTQLTRDHTMVQKMVDKGMLSAQEAFNHPNANILEHAIGHKPTVRVDITEELKLDDGDAILLCSDGLTGYVRDLDIMNLLRNNITVQEIPKCLVDLALETGGNDNITVQFIQYGTRKEASINHHAMKQNHIWKRFFSFFIIFLSGAVFSAVGSLIYLEKKKEENRAVIQDVVNSIDLSKMDAEKLRNQLQIVETERDTAAAEAKKFREQLISFRDKTGELEKKLADTGDLLKNAKKDADLNTAEVEHLRRQLITIQAEKDAAMRDVKICEEKLATIETESSSQSFIPF